MDGGTCLGQSNGASRSNLELVGRNDRIANLVASSTMEPAQSCRVARMGMERTVEKPNAAHKADTGIHLYSEGKSSISNDHPVG